MGAAELLAGVAGVTAGGAGLMGGALEKGDLLAELPVGGTFCFIYKNQKKKKRSVNSNLSCHNSIQSI